MHRFIAGAAVLAFALTGCGTRIASAPPRHIVALPVATTEVPPAAPAPAPRVTAARASRSAPVRLASVGRAVVVDGDVWTRLARCESGGNPKAVSRNGRYFGAFQFMLSSWRGVGMTGNPVDHDYEPSWPPRSGSRPGRAGATGRCAHAASMLRLGCLIGRRASDRAD